jgi:dTDP-4-amino-4,6-dideoxygalactose transaminase
MAIENIPFLDLAAQHQELEEQITSALKKVMKSCRFISGPEVEEFELNFAAYCGTKFAIGVGSGTDAIRFALLAAGVKNGDIVITVSNTFIATSEAISQAGAWPVFVDVDRNTYTMSVEKLEELLMNTCFVDDLTGETIHKSTGMAVRAVIPVHLYGQIAPMDEINKIAEKFKLLVIEDACQAHGARYYSAKQGTWIKAGALGCAGAFSFYPGKNLGAFGEAGAVTTDDPHIAQKIKMIRDHGQIKKYFHEMEGYNGRLDTIQAAILNIKLPYLDRWNAMRKEIGVRYYESLKDELTVKIPFIPRWGDPVFHLLVIRTPYRDMLQGYLTEQGIGTGLHYPVPLHLQKACRYLGYSTGSFPVTEQLAKEIISLPMYPSLSEKQISQVTEQISKFAADFVPLKKELFFQDE